MRLEDKGFTPRMSHHRLACCAWQADGWLANTAPLCLNSSVIYLGRCLRSVHKMM